MQNFTQRFVYCQKHTTILYNWFSFYLLLCIGNSPGAKCVSIKLTLAGRHVPAAKRLFVRSLVASRNGKAKWSSEFFRRLPIPLHSSDAGVLGCDCVVCDVAAPAGFGSDVGRSYAFGTGAMSVVLVDQCVVRQ